MVIKLFKSKVIILDGFLIGGLGIFPEISANDDPVAAFAQADSSLFDALVIEAHPVDQGLVAGQPKGSWFGIPRLWPGGNRTNFHERKAKMFQFINQSCIFVKAGCQTYRMVEVHA